MDAVFLKILNMSLTASWIVLAVLLLRLLLKRAPKWLSCLLWGVVGLRLIFPFSIESLFSLIPSAEPLPSDLPMTQTPAIDSGFEVIDQVVNPIISESFAPTPEVSANPLQIVLTVAGIVWLCGIVCMIAYGVVSYVRLRLRVRASIKNSDNVYFGDDIDSPFILGVVRPRIYLPSGMTDAQMGYVIGHEQAHLRRLDHIWKPLGFALLCLHWFNPLLWVAYILLCRDIESACDEKVIRDMDDESKKGYSETLVACSVHRRMIMACPVAFGELGVKARIKGILNYKKPSFWIILAAATACVITAVCFLTNPISCRHTYDSVITVPSTCTQKGIQTLTCTKCEHSYTAPADLLAHTYAPGRVLEEPDCVHAGTLELVCTECGAVKTGVMEMTAHTFGEPFLTKAPNCSETGEMSAQCQVCHRVQVVGTVGINHDHELHETLVVEASCTHSGEGVIACSRCDYEKPCTYGPLGHQYEYGPVLPGTCVRQNRIRMTCTACGEQWFELYPGYGDHHWLYLGGRYGWYCLFCGARKQDSVRQGTPLW